MLNGPQKSNGRRATRKGGPRYVLARRFVACLGALLVTGIAFASPPGAVISNQAELAYQPTPGVSVTVTSNAVTVTTAVVRAPSSVEFTRVLGAGTGSYQETVGPAACEQGGSFVLLADPVLIGGVLIDPTQLHEVSAAAAYTLAESAFMRLADADQNLDFQLIDYAVVTVSNTTSGDTETIRLSETGPNTGVFAGFVPLAGGTASSGDCALQGQSGSSIVVQYVDPADGGDTASDTALLDPVQRVFESVSGTAISNASIELVYASSGLPAIVYGNDGVSQFPSVISSGGTVMDSAGTSYTFGPGEYRFPVVPDGDYRLLVTPPPEYTAPSLVSISDLQNLPGAPYALQPGSFGNAFSKSGGITFSLDIPVDPRESALFLQKATTTTVAAPGDFVRYELQLENSSTAGTFSDVQIVDQLPPGVRYVADSTRIDAQAAPDPVLGADLRTLEFRIATLAVGQRVTITYVVEIIGGERNQDLVNRATATTSAGLVSNEASATIRLTEDLFRSTGTIIGRVLEAGCSQQTFSEEQGVANIRVYLEDGRYAVSDAGGRFHFEGLEPGTHVAQLDTFTVPEYFDVIGCDDAPAFAGRADSQFVKLAPGSLLRADFYLRRKPRPEGRIDLELQSSGTDSAEQVAYELTLRGKGNVAVDNIRLMFLLPDGVHYLPGTMRIGDAHAGDPVIQDSMLSMPIADQFGDWLSTVRFVAAIDADVTGEHSTKALARFDSPIAADQQTPVAETKMVRDAAVSKNEGYVLDLKFDVLSASLSAEDELKLDLLIEDWQGVSDIRIVATGHSDSARISARNQHLFENNYVLSEARAMAAAFYVADALQVPRENIQVTGRGADEPVASNDTAAGRQANRRVEMVLSGSRRSKPSFLQVTQESSGTMVTPTLGAIPGEETERNRARSDDELDAGMPASQVEPGIETLQPGVALLLPQRGFQPALPVTKVSVQHEPTQSIKIYLNDSPVSELNFDTTAVNAAKTVAVSRWKGVDLKDGDNQIRVIVSNADGSRAAAFTRSVYYSGAPIRGEFVAGRSSLVADGKTQPVVAVRMFDRAGKPSRTGTIGTYRVDAPYRSAWDVDNERKNKLVSIGPREPSYRVGADGIVLIELEPSTQSGEVVLNFKFDHEREQQLRVWLKPADREWILVGFAEGTAAYDTLSDNLSAALAAGHEEGYVDEGRVAFFAKGSIKGKYLMTIAYDSDRERSETRNSFDTVVDPNANYPLYADTSEQRFEAPSQRKLYVKLERSQFYALFGDYDTGLSVTDLARYERRFNGFKSEYRGDNIGYTAFAAESNQGFHRDEIRGDGTSGLYRLSVAPIIANSDKVRLEVRDRFDSGQVISTTNLHRFLDYNLDAQNGSLYFKRPVPSRDQDFNPVYIIVEYESASDADQDIVAGGRVSIGNAVRTLEAGVTYVSDDTAGAEADLSGVDLRWQVNPQAEFKAELASTSSIVAGVPQDGTAKSLELEYNGEKADVRAFVREVENGFGLGYQSAADRGFRRLGVEARGKFSEQWAVEGEAGWQQNLETEDIRVLAIGRVRYERDSFSTTLGLTHAEDEFEDGETRLSDIAELGVAQRMFDDRLTLRASGSSAISGDAENTDYPTSFVLGADYKLLKDVSLVGEYEDASGVGLDATMTRIGIQATPWNRTQVNTFVTNEVTEFGPRLFSNVGLVQGFQLNERWSLDFGVDQSNTLRDADARQFDPDRELATGSNQEDFLAAYVGAMYSAGMWSANSRFEHRNSDREERNTLLAGWYREPVAGHGMSAGMTLLQNDTIGGDDMTSVALKGGWAYRKSDKRWSFLNRTDLIFTDATQGGQQLLSWRLINNFNANRRLGAAAQLSLQYAFKFVRSEFDGDGYSGFTDLIGVDWRRSLSQRWDFGVNSSIYHAYQSGVFDYGAGMDVGFRLLDNMWLSAGYNVSGFYDADFTQARYTAQGPFLRFSVKADQHFLQKVTAR
ncbi:MAG: OmpA family protein [Gammaproteobacteria bacterium]|nr:OmpA family protein [Gammaproteobacteria bacterium]